MSQVGRISGPLLKSNLIRDGVDLAFETDLLYLDVDPGRIGINTTTPQYDLDVNGTSRTTNLIVDTQFDIGTLRVTGNEISSSLNTISFVPSGSDPTVYHSKLQIDDIQITGNTISTTVSNSNLELRPNGTGTIELQASTQINGNLYLTGNIVADGNVTINGNIQFGSGLEDTLTIQAAIGSNLIPQTDDAHDLGSVSFRWRSVYADNVYADTLNVPTLDVGNLVFRDSTITTTPGQDLYIDGNSGGGVRFANFRVVDNVITNVVSGAVTQIIQSGTGYFRIGGTNAFVPPVGTSGEQPTAYAEVGMMRYNTTSKSLEIWDGVAWASPSGASGAVSEIIANEIAAIFAIMLG